jgi:hypothetical protein
MGEVDGRKLMGEVDERSGWKKLIGEVDGRGQWIQVVGIRQEINQDRPA